MQDGDTPSLADRMMAARARERRQQEQREQKALARPRQVSDEVLDQAVIHGDQTAIASLAEQRIVDPRDALIVAGIVNYEHPENRTRSVWLADRALTAARYPHRMDEIADEVGFDRQLNGPANPEVHHRIREKVIDNVFHGALSDWSEEPAGTKLERWGDDPAADLLDLQMLLELPPSPVTQNDPDRPIERLSTRLRM